MCYVEPLAKNWYMFTKQNDRLKYVGVSYAESSIVNHKAGLKRGDERPSEEAPRRAGSVKMAGSSRHDNKMQVSSFGRGEGPEMGEIKPVRREFAS